MNLKVRDTLICFVSCFSCKLRKDQDTFIFGLCNFGVKIALMLSLLNRTKKLQADVELFEIVIKRKALAPNFLFDFKLCLADRVKFCFVENLPFDRIIIISVQHLLALHSR